MDIVDATFGAGDRVRRDILTLVVGSIAFCVVALAARYFNWGGQPADVADPALIVPLFVGFASGSGGGFVVGEAGALLYHLLIAGLPTSTGSVPADLGRILVGPAELSAGIMGLIAGLAAPRSRRYVGFGDQVRAAAATVVAIAAGKAFYWYGSGYLGHPGAEFAVPLPQVLDTLILAVIAIFVLPVLLFNFSHLDLLDLDILDCARSGIIRRVTGLVMFSSALSMLLLALLYLTRVVGAPSGLLNSVVGSWLGLGAAAVLMLMFTTMNAMLVAHVLSRPLLRLSAAAQAMQAGELSPEEAARIKAASGDDEVSKLSRVFGEMAEDVIRREQSLRKQVAELQLHIQIDEAKKAAEVAQVTDTDYFRDLQQRASRIRSASRQARAS